MKDYREAYSLQISNATGLDFNIRRVSEVATFQFLAWYQEQLAKYNDCVLDYPVHDISLDRDITAEFKVMIKSVAFPIDKECDVLPHIYMSLRKLPSPAVLLRTRCCR